VRGGEQAGHVGQVDGALRQRRVLRGGELLRDGEHHLQRRGLERAPGGAARQLLEHVEVLARLEALAHAELAQQRAEAAQVGRDGVQVRREVQRRVEGGGARRRELAAHPHAGLLVQLLEEAAGVVVAAARRVVELAVHRPVQRRDCQSHALAKRALAVGRILLVSALLAGIALGCTAVLSLGSRGRGKLLRREGAKLRGEHEEIGRRRPAEEAAHHLRVDLTVEDPTAGRDEPSILEGPNHVGSDHAGDALLRAPRQKGLGRLDKGRQPRDVGELLIEKLGRYIVCRVGRGGGRRRRGAAEHAH